jgi:hypothetical protein
VILAYISGGDSFEFANPQSNITCNRSAQNYYTPSFFDLQSTEVTTFGTEIPASTDRYGLNFGESVLSLRKLIRRSQVVDTVPIGNPANNTGIPSNCVAMYRKGFQRMPYTPGYQAWSTLAGTIEGGTSTSRAEKVMATGQYNYCFNTMHMLPYVTGMFLGYRGSVNYTITFNSPVVKIDDVRLTRATDDGCVTPTNRIMDRLTSVLVTNSWSNKLSRYGAFGNLRDGLAGYALTSASTAPSVQVTFPDCNNYNFSVCDPSVYYEGTTVDGTADQGMLLSFIIGNNSTTDNVISSTLTTSAAAGADFTCVFFLCCPTLDWLSGDATPI